MEGGARWATVHGVSKSRTRLSEFTSLHLTPEKPVFRSRSKLEPEMEEVIALKLGSEVK